MYYFLSKYKGQVFWSENSISDQSLKHKNKKLSHKVYICLESVSSAALSGIQMVKRKKSLLPISYQIST